MPAPGAPLQGQILPPMGSPQAGPPPGLPGAAAGSPMGLSQPPMSAGPPPVTIDAVMRLLRDHAQRLFRVDIEVDSTIAGDEARERTDRIAAVETITKTIETFGPMTTAQPLLTDLAGDLLQFVARGFRTARTLETSIEETVEKIKQQAGQPKPPPQPSPDELIKAKTAQAKGQAEVTKAQIDAQTARFEADARMQELQIEAQAAAQSHVHEMQQGAQEAALAGQQARNEAASQQMKAEVEAMRFRRAVDAANAPPKPPTGGIP